MLRLASEKKAIVFLLMVMVALGQLGLDLYLSSMPHMALNLHTSNSLIKLTISVYLLCFGVSQMIYGPISDSIGRKPVINLGMIAFITGSLGCVFSKRVEELIFFRAIQGLGVGGISINIRAIIRDIFHGKQMAKVSAWIAICWTITPLIAPVIGGYLQTLFGWQANFLAMALYTSAIWCCSLWLLPETLPSDHKKPLHFGTSLRAYGRAFSDKIFLSFSVISALCYGYFITFITVSPFLLQTHLGLSPVQYGWTLLLMAGGTATGSLLCSRLIISLRLIHVILIGALLMVISSFVMVGLAWWGMFTVYALVLPPLVGSIGTGLIFSNCTVGAMTSYKANAAVGGASLGCIQKLGGVIFGVIISHIVYHDALPLSLQLLALSLLTLFLYFLFIHFHFEEEIDHLSPKKKESVH